MRSLMRGALAVTLAATLQFNEAAAQAAPLVVPDGTPVRLRLRQNLSSADAQVGQTVDFELLEDITVNGTVVASRGSAALATVTEARAKGRMGKGGRLNVNIDHLRLINGERAALRAVRDAKGDGRAGAMTGAIVATSIVFFPAAPLFLLMKGKDITIPQGTQITAYISGDVRVDPARLMANQAAPQYVAPGAPYPVQPAAMSLVSYQQSGPPPQVNGYQAAAPPAPVAAHRAGMTNEDVIELKLAGFSDDVIISKIRSSTPAFRVETTDLLRLKRQEVPQRVIAAMIERAAQLD